MFIYQFYNRESELKELKDLFVKKVILESQHVKNFYDLYLHQEPYKYMFDILSFKVILNNPAKYGYYIPDSIKIKPWKFDEVFVTSTITDIPQFAIANNITFNELKKYNPWIGNTYQLFIEPGQTASLRDPLFI